MILGAVEERPDICPGGASGVALRSWCGGGGLDAVALLRRPQTHLRRVRACGAVEGQLELDPERLVFIDETGASTKMARLYGRAPRGRRLRAGVPHGIENHHLRRRPTPDGHDRAHGARRPHNRGLDPGLRGQVLVPTLRPGDVVVLANLPAHKPGIVRSSALLTGNFNRIENAFPKLKALLRRAAARTIDELWRVIGDSLDAFRAAECANYFAASGYDAS